MSKSFFGMGSLKLGNSTYAVIIKKKKKSKGELINEWELLL